MYASTIRRTQRRKRVVKDANKNLKISDRSLSKRQRQRNPSISQSWGTKTSGYAIANPTYKNRINNKVLCFFCVFRVIRGLNAFKISDGTLSEDIKCISKVINHPIMFFYCRLDHINTYFKIQRCDKHSAHRPDHSTFLKTYQTSLRRHLQLASCFLAGTEFHRHQNRSLQMLLPMPVQL